MCSGRLCGRRVGNRDPRFGVGVDLDVIGAIVTVGTGVVLTSVPVPLLILRIFPPVDVFLVFGVPGVLSAGAVQDGWGGLSSDGDTLVGVSAPMRDLDLMSRRLGERIPDVDRRRSEGRAARSRKDKREKTRQGQSDNRLRGTRLSIASTRTY